MLLVSAPAQTFKVLYNFGSQNGDPREPGTPGIISQSRGGNLYSATPLGGGAGGGAVFRVTQGGALTVIYSFQRVRNSAYPEPNSGLTLGTDGNLYGTTNFGGASDNGTLFRIDPASGAVTTLYSFSRTLKIVLRCDSVTWVRDFYECWGLPICRIGTHKNCFFVSSSVSSTLRQQRPHAN